MSDLTGMEIYFKKDFLQYTGSFKERGARYSLLKLSKVDFHFFKLLSKIVNPHFAAHKISFFPD